ncbi:MAG: protein kinase [Candidatus Hydrogenedentes bacterium]|nr:protein kinase [Candidatus Hydrogenedentota bacterium]
MEQDRNLLFGVLAVQLGKVSSSRLMQAAAAWAVDPTQPIHTRLVDDGALSAQDCELIQRFVAEAIHAHAGDARATLNTFGGEDQVLKTFGGAIKLTNEGAQPASTRPQTATTATPTESDTGVLETPGRYQFVSEQGKGGYGRVCLVRDSFMARDIAMKELIPPSDEPIGSRAATPSREAVEAVSRFLQEARITGQLEHPSIVPVYELGHRSDGTLYYTMKLVRGQTLSKELAKRTTLRERLGLLTHYLDLCHAVAYAHDRGVIHRDIKPDNVMLGNFGETVVIDWGLAKLKGRADVYAAELKETVRILKDETPSPTSQTLYGTILGTPHFMAPEQARGDIDNVDERSDVYALGAVLYKLLTGKRPYDNAPLQNVILHMNLLPLTPIVELAPDAPPELVTICSKALERQQTMRYPNAAALAEEISRFTSGALVQSHQYTLRDQLRRFVHKHRAQVATAAAALATLLVVAIVSYVQVLQANTSEREQRITAQTAERLATEKGKQEAEARAVAEQELYVSNIRLAHQSIERNQFSLARTLLAACPPAHRNFEWGWLQNRCNSDLATLRGHSASVQHIAVNTNGKLAASGDAAGAVILWDIESGAEIRRATLMDVPIHALGFSPDGESLVVAGAQTKVLVCTTGTFQSAATLDGHGAAVNGAAYSPDGRLIATASSDDTARVWTAATRESVAVLREHLNDVIALAWAPDQSFLVTASLDDSAIIWDSATWTVRARLAGHRNDLSCVTISPDGAQIATGGSDSNINIWSASTGALLNTHTFQADVRDMAFAPNGKQLAVALDGPVAYLVEVDDSSRAPFPIRGHAGNISAVALAPAGDLLLTGADTVVKVWHAPGQLIGPPRATTGTTGQEVHLVDRAHSKLAVASTEGTCHLYDIAASAPLGRIDNLGHSGLGGRLWQFASDSSYLLFTPDDNRPKVYNLLARSQQELAITGSPFFPAISPDNATIAISSTSGIVELFDAKSGQLTKTLSAAKPGNHLLPIFSPDATAVAIAFMDKEPSEITLLSIASASPAWTAAYPGEVASALFSSGGKQLLVSGSTGLVVLDATTGAVAESPLSNPLLSLSAIALSPDETRLAAEVEGAGIIIFDAVTGREVLRFERPVAFPPASPLDHGDLFFSADGRSLRFVTTEYQGRDTIASFDTVPWNVDALPGEANQTLEQRIDAYKRQQRLTRAQEATQWDRAYEWMTGEVARSRQRFAGAAPQQDLFANAAEKEWDISPSQWSMLLQMGRTRLKNLRDVHGYRGMEISTDLVVDRSLAEFLAVLGFENNDIIVRIDETSTPGYDMFIEALERAQREGSTEISVYFMRSGEAIIHRYFKTEPKPAEAATAR